MLSARGKVASDREWRRVPPYEDVDAARVRYLTIVEARRLIKAASPSFRPLVEAALQTGARYGELTRLRVEDFISDSGTVLVRHSKSGKSRHIVLTDEGQRFFARVTKARPGGEVMFVKANGIAWSRSEQIRPMREACERAKISPAAGFHVLRHSWASLSIMAGVPLEVAAKNLGHVDGRMTEKHYSHLAPSYIADKIRAGAPRFGSRRRG